MSKSITVGPLDEIENEMKRFKDVNWTAITRQCIRQYIKQRSSPGLEPAIQKVKEMRQTDFKKGFDFVIENVNNGYIDTNALEEMLHYDRNSDNKGRNEYALFNMLPEKLRNHIFVPNPKYKVNFELPKYVVSSDFRSGMKEAAVILLRK